ncbi:MAG: MogA/MoaB family molybdenum cofactor biosynthesis protein [Candidatus Omnitrophica bacterium]|nr:MogA/MoaB family molybdenum cofactor biosynthesis protein [Candidatus Omnitrophota bacterium]MDD5236488.1 MogA/MoaB family molybdenum cofactor biosynthesis protein [Candidatus Omnitrophota bacterium]MDD5611158.1 MogA/MoaB family molybdenum cofactor biosynthesis protein [Candidatus Omnitrophota bacterium]
MKIGIIVASDKGSRKEREDKSGLLIKDIVSKELHAKECVYCILPDDEKEISDKLIALTEERCNIIFTTGGTGLSARDVTPEATLKVIDKEVPGICEAMRLLSFKSSPRSILSRAVAGIRKKTLIINLPGSPRAVEECLDIILPALDHAVGIISGEASECGRGELDHGNKNISQAKS